MGGSRRRRRNRRNSRGRSSRGTSVRVTRTKGSATSHHTGGLSITGMSPTGRISNLRPTIQATVIDAGSRLAKQDIKFYLDGSEKSRFHFDPASGRLTYHVGNALQSGTHRVEIEAEVKSSESQVSTSGSARKRWTFTVAR